jgi:hypothetical protein
VQHTATGRFHAPAGKSVNAVVARPRMMAIETVEPLART